MTYCDQYCKVLFYLSICHKIWNYILDLKSGGSALWHANAPKRNYVEYKNSEFIILTKISLKIMLVVIFLFLYLFCFQ
jgi:hypothetical protein